MPEDIGLAEGLRLTPDELAQVEEVERVLTIARAEQRELQEVARRVLDDLGIPLKGDYHQVIRYRAEMPVLAEALEAARSRCARLRWKRRFIYMTVRERQET